MDWTIGKEYDLLVVSFDSKEGHELAAKKKVNYLDVYGREGVEKGWHFLTGSEESVQALTRAVGFKFKWVEKANEWAHSSAAIMISPEGKLTRYLYGVMFDEKDLKIAVNEAAEGKVGGIIDRLVLFCFQFNPEKNKYTLHAFNAMRAGGGVTVLLLMIWLIPTWMRNRRRGDQV